MTVISACWLSMFRLFELRHKARRLFPIQQTKLIHQLQFILTQGYFQSAERETVLGISKPKAILRKARQTVTITMILSEF